jgi:hypothetical protein
VVRTIGGIQERFGASVDVALVQKKIANFFAEFGSAWLEGANNLAPLGAQVSFEKVGLS